MRTLSAKTSSDCCVLWGVRTLGVHYAHVARALDRGPPGKTISLFLRVLKARAHKARIRRALGAT